MYINIIDKKKWLNMDKNLRILKIVKDQGCSYEEALKKEKEIKKLTDF